MDNIKYLAETAQAKRATFLALRQMGTISPETLKRFAIRYVDAVEAWHKAAKPGRKFYRPSFGYLIRAL